MSDVVLSVENVSKRFRIGAREPYHRFSEVLTGLARAAVALPRRWLTPPSVAPNSSTDPQEFWALKDVSFEVKQGEVVGIIGRNGAGKSTLLKVLSRITEPTSGRIGVRGRIGSLLEVGTGFHPELTGRENIYLNGAILGMSRAEVQRRFDEIVAFAEIDQFLDTPVKRYSSGMYVRLGFAVAAHLETEILIVDEVLAVGDAAFQRRCLGKMNDAARGGRTVLFVSHNMAASRAFCRNGLLLNVGRLQIAGPMEEVIAAYLHAGMDEDREYPVFAGDISILRFELQQDGRRATDLDNSRSVEVVIDFQLARHLTGFRIGVFVISPTLGVLTRTLTPDWDASNEEMPAGTYQAKLRLAPNFLMPGQYQFLLHASCFGVRDYLYEFQIQRTVRLHADPRFNALHPSEHFESAVLLSQPWSLERQCARVGSDWADKRSIGTALKVAD